MQMKKKKTQYARILQALRAAGRKGCTTLDLIIRCGTTCPHKRIAEMPVWYVIGKARYYIDKSFRIIGNRKVRLYRLVRCAS